MTRRILITIAALCAVLAFGAAPASAGGEGYTPTNITTTVNGDGSVRITGENCVPGSAYSYVVKTSGGTVAAEGSGVSDTEGKFAFTTAPLPDGTYTATITCGTTSQVASFSVGRAVAGGPTATTPSRPLAFTGSDALPLARLSLVLVASGGVAVYASKKRKDRQAAFTDA